MTAIVRCDDGTGGPTSVDAGSVEMLPPARVAVVDRLVQVAGTAGGRALLVAEPGMGKTTLLDQAVRGARAAGVRVLHARASEPGSGQPFHSLVDLLAEVEPQRWAQLPEVQRDALELALALRPVTGVLPPMALPIAMATVVSAMLVEQPVLIAVDDWPWLDAETGSVLRYVLTRPLLTGQAVALVATQRLEGVLTGRDDGFDHALFAPDQVLEVPRLGMEDLSTALTSRLRLALPAETMTALHDASGGNPLWAMEVAKTAALPSSALGLREQLPGSIADVALRRVQSLPGDARRALAVVGAMGRGSTALVIAAVGGTFDPLRAALEAEVVLEVEGRLIPSHPMLGAAALRSLAPREQMAVHADIAAVTTSATERAYHLERSLPPGPREDVAVALTRAARDTLALGAAVSAMAMAERAVVRTPPDSPDLDERTVFLAEAASAAMAFDRVRSVILDTDLSCLDEPLFDRAMFALTEALNASGGDEVTLEVLAALQQRLSRAPAQVAVLQGYSAEVQLQPAPVRRELAAKALLVLEERPGLPFARHRALGALMLADLDAGFGISPEMMRELADPEQRLASGFLKYGDRIRWGTYFAALVGDIQGSRMAVLAAVEEARAGGDLLFAGLLLLPEVVWELLRGRPAAAAVLMSEFDALDPWGEAPFSRILGIRGWLAISRGDAVALEAMLQLPFGRDGVVVGRLVRSALRGIWAARRQDWSTALPALLEARRLAEAQGLREPGRRMWIDAELGETLVALGRLDEGLAVADWLGEVADHGNRPLVRGVELRIRGLVAAGGRDLPFAERSLVESVALLAASDFQFEQARSMLELVRVLRRSRARSRARTLMAEVLALAEDIDDPLLLTRVRAQLPASVPGRPSNGLTLAEERVAVAAAEGLSNAEIAAAQFLSIRTVESHLSTTYRKLGVRSRGQLAARLPRPAGTD